MARAFARQTDIVRGIDGNLEDADAHDRASIAAEWIDGLLPTINSRMNPASGAIQ
jgi:hypothetical protein